MLREERGLRVFENRVLRRLFGTKRDEIIGDWGELNNEQRNDLCFSPKIIRMFKSMRMRVVGHKASIGEKRNAYRDLM
jgi:hypothetical protein